MISPAIPRRHTFELDSLFFLVPFLSVQSCSGWGLPLSSLLRCFRGWLPSYVLWNILQSPFSILGFGLDALFSCALGPWSLIRNGHDVYGFTASVPGYSSFEGLRSFSTRPCFSSPAFPPTFFFVTFACAMPLIFISRLPLIPSPRFFFDPCSSFF